MPIQRRHRRRIAGFTALAVACSAIAALLATAGSAASNDPTMEVLPKTTGLSYGQTVEIKAHHLPKGSGTVAATICGITDASGKAIASPTADDCAGAESVGKLVIVKSWQSDGEFDTKYTLPASKQQFGKNKRFCDATHYCALVVADANPDNPAYHVATNIFFSDQQAPDGSTSTTKPSDPGSTPTGPAPGSPPPNGGNGGNGGGGGSGTPGNGGGQAQPPSDGSGSGSGSGGVSGSGSGDASLDPNNPHIHVQGNFAITPPSGGGAPSLPTPAPPPAPTLPPQAADALNQVCSQLAAAVKQAGGDASALTTVCSSIASGSGPAQLKAVLAAPSLLCLAAQSAWQNNPQITAACNQAAAGLQPVTGPVGGALP